MEKEILKVLVGSRAHGIHTEDSDYDYRGVFVLPTKEFFRVDVGKTKGTNWIEGEIDNTSWEVGHFLRLATKSNPSILEVFFAPLDSFDDRGIELIGLFDSVWSSKGVYNAYNGYAINQIKKILDLNNDNPSKYAANCLRVLYNGYELLTKGTFTTNIALTEVGEQVKNFKNGVSTFGEIIDECTKWQQRLKIAFEANPDKETNFEPVNEYLLSVRKSFLD
jgi:hypothetical protein